MGSVPVVTLFHFMLPHSNRRDTSEFTGPKLEDLVPATECPGSEVMHILIAHSPLARTHLQLQGVAGEE